MPERDAGLEKQSSIAGKGFCRTHASESPEVPELESRTSPQREEDASVM